MTYPETPTQRYLASLGACDPAREWVADRTLAECWERCERLDWLQWLVQAEPRAAYDRAMAVSLAAYDRDTAAPRAAYERAMSEPLAAYCRAMAEALACSSCDDLRSKFPCPEVPA
jgi:hypothetical protein